MEEKSVSICPICGEEITRTVYDKGFLDNYGHSPYGVSVNGCECAARYTIKVKPMCTNCAFNSYGECVQPHAMKSLETSLFEVPTSLRIKDERMVCKYHKLSLEQFSQFFVIK